MDEITAPYVHERIRENDITVWSMMLEKGWGRDKCERIIAKLVAEKKLVPVTVLNKTNQQTTAYRKPGDTERHNHEKTQGGLS